MVISDSDSFSVSSLSIDNTSSPTQLAPNETFRAGTYSKDLGTGVLNFAIDTAGVVTFTSPFADRSSIAAADLVSSFTQEINIFSEDLDSPFDSPLQTATTKTVTIDVTSFQNTVVVQLSFAGTTSNGVYIPNETYFEDGQFSNAQGGTFAAKYAGAAGNGLKIYALSEDSWDAVSTAVAASPTTATSEETAVYNSFDIAPVNDEILVAVVDVLGTFGVAGTVLETFA